MRTKDRTLLANLGDVNPIDYGGLFVYSDGSCVKLEEPCDDAKEPFTWTAYRFDAEKCYYTNGVLSDNEFHKDMAVWFAKDLKTFADAFEITVKEMAARFCSDDIVERAGAWREVGEYWGFGELDHYPETYTKGELYRYFRKECYGGGL